MMSSYRHDPITSVIELLEDEVPQLILQAFEDERIEEKTILLYPLDFQSIELTVLSGDLRRSGKPAGEFIIEADDLIKDMESILHWRLGSMSAEDERRLKLFDPAGFKDCTTRRLYGVMATLVDGISKVVLTIQVELSGELANSHTPIPIHS